MHAKKLTITNRQKALLHAVKQANNLSDAQYREILYEAAGVWTSTGLTQAGFDQVLDAFATLRYEMPAIRPRPHFTERAGRASPRQLQYIEALRRKVFPEVTEGAFNRWLDHYFHISHLHFLTPR
ncbi:MAG: regulatory protein GemA, partial [Chloroflexi bacterium]|nr:regulatory protein GemA [Chloroflexota bacterium]